MPEEEILLDRIANSMAGLKYNETLEFVKEALNDGISAQTIIIQGLARGLELVGQKFEGKEYFLAELMMATHIMNTSLELLEPALLSTESTHASGVLVIGTVKDDIHDIGKNIVVTLAKAAGLQVHDLGVDTPSAAFVEQVQKLKPDIVGLSTLLSSTTENMQAVIEALKTAGLRDQVVVMIGGGPTSEPLAKKIGADAYASNAIHGIRSMIAYCMEKHKSGQNVGKNVFL